MFPQSKYHKLPAKLFFASGSNIWLVSFGKVRPFVSDRSCFDPIIFKLRVIPGTVEVFVAERSILTSFETVYA